MAPAGLNKRRGGGDSAEQSVKPAHRSKSHASGWPVHVTVGCAAAFAIAVIGAWHWWSGNPILPARKRPASSKSPIAPWAMAQAPAPLWAKADALGERLQANITCTKAVDPGKGACASPRLAGRCARFVVDDVIPVDTLTEVKKMVQWLIDEAWGAGSGPPSVVDLHAGSISYKDKFVDLAALMDFKKAKFTDAQVEAYNEVRKVIRSTIGKLFGVPEAALLHDMTFFSHINASKVAKTVHDEYWHKHTDTEQYGTFSYTSLLYLSTAQEDFDGGSFVFEDKPAQSAVAPRFGRLVVFTSDAENPHSVEQVTQGIRIALTSAFTCNTEKAKSIESFPENFAKRDAVREAEKEAEKAGR